MNCDVTPEMLGAYFDSELDALQSAALSGHVEACPRCGSQLEEMGALRAGLRDPSLIHAIPPDFLRKTRFPGVTAGRGWREFRPMARSLAAASALAAAFLLGGVLLPRLLSPGSAANSRELVSAHLRSLQPGKLFDVASSDQHTVKPWFAGKVDFSPPVALLSTDGFELLGGRVDVIGDHSAAALVYSRRLHKINVFLWPESQARESDLAPSGFRGLNVVGWEHAGFRGYAVSDLNARELAEFSRLFRSKE